jgi:serine/threonine-protein kinase
VHRDVSPQNILIGVDGVARLTDFGIAKATSRLTVTRDGQLKGKIAYMAPEQTKRVEIDRRVDIFAMGIITWEMLASRKLFTGESDVEVLNQLLFEPIPRSKESAPGIPPAIDAAVMKALERDPAKRYATAAEFADALERASKVLGGPANARTVAAHLQKVSAEKIARDRARVSNAGTPTIPGEGQSIASRVRRATGNFPAANTGQHSTNTGQHGAIELPDEPSRPGTPAPAANAPVRSPKATMVGIPPAPPLPPTSTGPAIKATPSNPPAAPIVSADQTLVDDDEDIPTSAVVRTKEMAEALGVPNRAMPSTKTPGGPEPLASVPAATANSFQPAPAVGPPPLLLTKPASVPPAANVTPVSTSVPVERDAPGNGRRNLFIVMTLVLIAGGVGTAALLARTTNGGANNAPANAPTQTNRVATPPPSTAATTTQSPPSIPTEPVAPPSAIPSAPPIAAAPGATNAEPPPSTNVAANSPAPTNAASNANPPAATANGSNAEAPTQPAHAATNAGGTSARSTHTTSTHASSAAHGGSHGGATSTSSGTAHSTGHGSAGHSTHDDDPFGTDNPYQR